MFFTPHPARARMLGRNRRLASRLYMDALESRVLLSAVEPIGGIGNNVANPTWGSAGTDLIRLAAAAYSDGIDSPTLPGDASARAISNILNNQADPNNPGQDINTLDQNNLSDFGYIFGQFIDHDMDLTLDGGASFDIPVTADDPIGPANLAFTRSQTDPTAGTSTSNPAQQINSISSYLDLSQVYGSDVSTDNALRTMKNGLLKTSPGNMLPYLNSTYFTAAQLATFNSAAGGQQNLTGLPSTAMFATGDVRGNENIELIAMETLFVRNHNKIAGQLKKEHPGWSDQQLFDEARKLNIAEYQSIVYTEWLPAVLGPNALTKYKGYNPNVNVSVSNEFSTVAFRFGHSMLSPDIDRDTNQGVAAEPSVPLALDFFDPTLINPNGVIDPVSGQVSTDIGPILKSAADGNGEAVDMMAVDGVRNLLFGDFGAGGDDLMARDVQRGRDNGIPDYNTLRVAMGLPAVTSFAQITSNVQVQQELAQAYPGGVDTIDAFEGGLAEDHVPGSDVGPLFQAIIVDQFQRTRDGDRFFYQNESFNRDEMNILQSGNSLTKVIEANTNITNMQANAFIFTASISGTVSGPAATPFGTHSNNGLAGITMQLTDSDGDVLATTTTDANGQYVFTQQTGIEGTGIYSINVVWPAGLKPGVASAPDSILISRGGMNATINYTVATSAPPPVTHRPSPPRRGHFAFSFSPLSQSALSDPLS